MNTEVIAPSERKIGKVTEGMRNANLAGLSMQETYAESLVAFTASHVLTQLSTSLAANQHLLRAQLNKTAEENKITAACLIRLAQMKKRSEFEIVPDVPDFLYVPVVSNPKPPESNVALAACDDQVNLQAFVAHSSRGEGA